MIQAGKFRIASYKFGDNPETACFGQRHRCLSSIFPVYILQIDQKENAPNHVRGRILLSNLHLHLTLAQLCSLSGQPLGYAVNEWEKITIKIDENLGFILEPQEGSGMKHTIAITLESCAVIRLVVQKGASLAIFCFAHHNVQYCDLRFLRIPDGKT